jgi:thiol-disulfide isomerase/thioredoxin
LDGGGELALSELRGKRVLLVFSDPHCGPCNELAPELEKFHRQHPQLELVMIRKGDPKENRAKVKEYGLTIPLPCNNNGKSRAARPCSPLPSPTSLTKSASLPTTSPWASMRFEM